MGEKTALYSQITSCIMVLWKTLLCLSEVTAKSVSGSRKQHKLHLGRLYVVISCLQPVTSDTELTNALTMEAACSLRHGRYSRCEVAWFKLFCAGGVVPIYPRALIGS
ncbi:hypothetical protein HD806DRAFT_517353 [Xylariaceae sp. AK1471]|nr:hypothetical protein HD806DRAFT_517353 [Xylariaceae sp. AK1471]